MTAPNRYAHWIAFLQRTPRLLVTGLCLWSSSCSVADRWGASTPVPVAPHYAGKKDLREGGRTAGVMQAFAMTDQQGAGGDQFVEPLAHTAEPAKPAERPAKPATQTNDPFARTATAPPAQEGVQRSVMAPPVNSQAGLTGISADDLQLLAEQSSVRARRLAGSSVRPADREIENAQIVRAFDWAESDDTEDLGTVHVQQVGGQMHPRPGDSRPDHRETSAVVHSPASQPQPTSQWSPRSTRSTHQSEAAQTTAITPVQFQTPQFASRPEFHPGAPCPTADCPPIPWQPHPAYCGVPEFAWDEYVCDGGDRRLPVHYNGSTRNGLEAEDTIVEYNDGSGKMRVKATNRACVYAPRFGAVRSIAGTSQDLQIVKAGGVHDRSQVAGFEHRMTVDEQRQHADPLHLATRSRANAVDQLVMDAAVSQRQNAFANLETSGAHQSRGFLSDGLLAKLDPAVLAASVDAALDWSQQQPVVIQGQYRSGHSVEVRAYAQEKVGVEDQRRPADLHIRKLADRKSAAAGEIIRFTIHFENYGDREVLEFRLIDHISPRLEYVEGSVEASLPGQLDREADGQGGEVLTFTFGEPLAGQSSAWVSFECKVR